MQIFTNQTNYIEYCCTYKKRMNTHIFFKCIFYEYYKWKIYLNISLNTPEVNVHNNLTWHELLIFIGIKTILYTCILRDVIFLSHFTTVRYWNFFIHLLHYLIIRRFVFIWRKYVLTCQCYIFFLNFFLYIIVFCNNIFF